MSDRGRFHLEKLGKASRCVATKRKAPVEEKPAAQPAPRRSRQQQRDAVREAMARAEDEAKHRTDWHDSATQAIAATSSGVRKPRTPDTSCVVTDDLRRSFLALDHALNDGHRALRGGTPACDDPTQGHLCTSASPAADAGPPPWRREPGALWLDPFSWTAKPSCPSHRPTALASWSPGVSGRLTDGGFGEYECGRALLPRPPRPQLGKTLQMRVLPGGSRPHQSTPGPPRCGCSGCRIVFPSCAGRECSPGDCIWTSRGHGWRVGCSRGPHQEWAGALHTPV